MTAPRVYAYLRNPDWTRGTLCDDHLGGKVKPVFNDIGTWSLSLPLSSQAATAILDGDPGYGVIFRRSNQTLMSGPINSQDIVLADRAQDRLEIAGPDDNAWLAWRWAAPCTATGTSGTIYGTAAYDTVNSVAETALHHYVYNNLGAGAAVARRLPGLTQATDLGRGTTVKDQARFDTLLEVLQRIARKGGGLGFRLTQVDNHLEFQVYAPVDRSSTVIFSRPLGNLRDAKFGTQGPQANYLSVAGGGEGTLRTFEEGGDSSSITQYGRREGFVDRRDTTDSTTLQQTRDDELAKQGEKRSVALTPIEFRSDQFTDFHPYYLLDDYFVGDTVGLNVRGVHYAEQLQSAEVTIGKTVEVKPILGTSNATDPNRPSYFNLLRELNRRLRSTETR